MKLQEKIISRIEESKFEAFTVCDLLDLDSYINLRKTLERMTKSNLIRRLIRGVYDIPKYNKTFNMMTPPSIEGIAKAIARNHNWNIYPSGNYALNLLGLSTQIPSKYVYISSGPYKSYEYDDILIEFKHASLKETSTYSYHTNLVIQAIKELGKENISENDINKIQSKFNKDELNIIIKEAKNTTIWIYEAILKLRG